MPIDTCLHTPEYSSKTPCRPGKRSIIAMSFSLLLSSSSSSSSSSWMRMMVGGLMMAMSEFHVAPMQGYTNAPMRYLLRQLVVTPHTSSNHHHNHKDNNTNNNNINDNSNNNQDCILWTEMEKVKDLLALDQEGLDKRFGLDDIPMVIQLGGNNVKDLATCVQRICSSGSTTSSRHDSNGPYRIRAIDLNCGCPSIESGGAATFGASLMKDSKLTRDLIRSIRDSIPLQEQHTNHNDRIIQVSLKCRIAVYESPQSLLFVGGGSDGSGDGDNHSNKKNNNEEEEYDYLCNYIRHAVDGGISQLVLHARPVVLSGLSPTKNRNIPPLNYDMVHRIATEFPQLHVILNGGIQSMERMESISHEYPNIHGIMVGRWILRRPLDLIHIGRRHRHDHRHDHPEELSAIGNDTEEMVILHRALTQYFHFLQENAISSHRQRGVSSSSVYTLSALCMPLYLVLEQLREDHVEEDKYHMVYDVLLETIQFLTQKDKVLLLSKSRISSSTTTTKITNWKKMSLSLKGLVGTKVYNKWKRNRSEL